MNELEEFESLKQELIDYSRKEFAVSHSYTLPVDPKEVEIVKKLILIAGGRETQEIMVECWNIARREYPQMCLAVLPEFPFYRNGWNKRGS